MHPLTGPYEKLVLAHHHLDRLNSEILKFKGTQRNDEIVIAEREPGGEYYALRARVGAMPPTHWGALIGEMAHDLRSALDGLVWQLIILNGVDPEKLGWPLPEFPIYLYGGKPPRKGRREARVTYENKGQFAIAGRVHADHEAIIKKLQPYHPRNHRRKNSLWVLHELNNADKHRLIQVSALATNGFNGGFMFGNEAPPGLSHREIRALTQWKPTAFLVDGAKVGRVHRSVVEQPVPVKYVPVPDIMFWQGLDALKGARVQVVLRNLFRHVKAVVFGDFGKFFPPTPEEWRV